MSSLSNLLFGRKGKIKQVPTVTPEQKGILDQLLGGISGPLGSGLQNLQNILGGGPEAFQAFEAPARTAFEQQTVPKILERLSGMGAQRSSALGQALGQAGAGLEENLAAQRAGLQSQALSQLQGLLGTGMTPQFGMQQVPGSSGALQGLMQMLGQGLGTVGQTTLTGGLGGLFSGKGFGTGMRRGFGF